MKNDNLSSLPVIPEEYEINHLGKIDFSLINSEMNEIERRFVNGLIRYYKPENILEIGVSRGGGSVVLLNAIKDISESNLTSIDRLEHFYGDSNIPVGVDVDVYSDELLPASDKWNLIKGKDPGEVMENLNKRFDFAVIDTAHIHPVETLNFLCVLPYLNDGAIVILHDISLFTRKENKASEICLATRILMSSIVGNKLVPRIKSCPFISEEELINNICAIQITPDTRKYIADVFYSLALPWGCYPVDDIKNIRNLLNKHYDESLIVHFNEATTWYSVYVPSGKSIFSLNEAKSVLKSKLSDDMIFYGAGKNMKDLLTLFDACDIPFTFPIWDKNADIIKSINGYAVINPDFNSKVTGATAVITIENKEIADSVGETLKKIGFDIINGKDSLFTFCGE